MGLTGKYPPFNYFDSTGKLVGFDVDMAHEICREIQRECVFIPQSWDGILGSLLSGKIDVIIGSMAITEERKKKVAFSVPYYESGAQLLVRPGSPPPTSKGFRIGVTLGTTYKEFASKEFPQAKVRSYKGDVEVLQDLGVGRLDGMVTDKLVGLYMAKSIGAPIVPYGPPLYLEEMGIPVRPSSGKLLSQINSAVTRLRGSALYDTLLQNYFGQKNKLQSKFSWKHSLSLMLKALWVTIQLSLQGIALGVLGALVLAILVIGLPKTLGGCFSFYIDFIRSTPFMVQLFAIYFGLPALSIELSPWTSGVLAIAIHSSAYLSEIIKVAYQSVPLYQHYATATLGLTGWESVRFIIWPQMLPVLLTPALNTVVAMIKDSAIVSVISVHELMMQTQELISGTFEPMEFYLVAAFLYFLITYPLLLLGRKLEVTFKTKGLLHG